MYLFEAANKSDDEFAKTKVTPQQEIELLGKRRDALMYHKHHLDDVIRLTKRKIIGTPSNTVWNARQKVDHAEEIQRVIDKGFIPVWTVSRQEKGEVVDYFLPDNPSNRALAPVLSKLERKMGAINNAINDTPSKIRNVKSRLSAWKRQQPDYVARDEGKEVAQQLSDDIVEHLKGIGLPVRVANQFYWKKNKMVVIEIATTLDRPWTVKPWEVMDQKIKPAVDAYLKENGYNKVRLGSYYNKDINQSVLKLQLDDAEARDVEKTEGSNESI